MVTLQKASGLINRNILEIIGLSTDVKPIDYINSTYITNGSKFEEIDTGIVYKYDAGNKKWVKKAISDESGEHITLDYLSAINKPQINGIELNGNKTLDDLGIQKKGAYIVKETDPTVPTWAKAETKPTYTAAEVGALPDTINVMRNPKKVIFTGAVVGEYDGSVEKTFNIPTYTLPQAKESTLGGIKAKAKTNETVEVAIDAATGKLFVPTYPTQARVEIDKTLTAEGKAADAKSVGDALKSKVGADSLTPYLKVADAEKKYAMKTELPKKGVAVANAGDTDVKDKLNALLESLRTAGVIAQ